MLTSDPSNWNLYKGNGKTPSKPIELPPAPSWRQFRDDAEGAAKQQQLKGENFKPPDVAVEMVNAALALRRPLLITGNPGTGKSSLAYAVAREMGLGKVLKWAITTRTTLKDGLYSYDAIARLQDAQASGEDNRKETGNYITLGPLGTAFLPADLPRVLLIDEIDKSDIDLPNDLLNLFEDGEFPIPELQRLELSKAEVRTIDRDKDGKQRKAPVLSGVVRCRAFPLVIMTSNGERDFPPPFLRRCLRLKMPNPSPKELQEIVEKHLGEAAAEQSKQLIQWFCDQIEAGGTLANDQLLNVIHLRTQERTRPESNKKTKARPDEAMTLTLTELEKRLLKDLSSPEEI
ncbi:MULTISPECIES: MoxR family ATPase [Trichocoleus]|uniref:MoxR family ATPase n=1 Tax=Trichocoleus desertorum GB2-A4 TaxID=2933944 RepID=A0ABV0JF16_9CYAN|nr:MoxR family ATPase [Trichocoleus sp. FACHB-46]MBD1865021.1 MoxR family ATPase [Trichocoleus sp. FACHB-46]